MKHDIELFDFVVKNPSEVEKMLKVDNVENQEYYPQIMRCLSTLQLLTFRDLTDFEQEMLDYFIDIDYFEQHLERKYCGIGLIRTVIDRCERVVRKRKLTDRETKLYNLACHRYELKQKYQELIRNLTEEESAIYDDWLNAEAKKTGERLF